LRIVDPPERERGQRCRYDERKQHDRPEERLEREMLVEQKRKPKSQRELDHAGYERIEECVEQSQPRYRIVPKENKILESDPFPCTSDLGICEAEPGAEPEGIGQKDQQQRCRRQHEDAAEQVAVVEGARERALARCDRKPLRGEEALASGTV